MSPDLDLYLDRIIRALRKDVCEAWTDPVSLGAWWLPAPLRCRVEQVDVVPGGRAAHRGDVLISPSITVRPLSHFSATSPLTVTVQPATPLTDRKEDVLRCCARGRSNAEIAEIAEKLFISLGTVKTHLSSLQDKVGARNRFELAAFAWQSGRMRD
jgi:DNA-binding NarL/FixJ family response regulator